MARHKAACKQQRTFSVIFISLLMQHYLFPLDCAMINMDNYEFMTGRYAYEYGRYDSEKEGRKGPFS